jgi:hypothetical protein
MPNPKGRANRFIAALSAGVIALVVAIVVGVLLAKAVGEGIVPVLGTLAAFGLVSAWLYTRAVDGPIRRANKPARRD